MNDILQDYSHIIANYTIKKDKEENGAYFFEVRIEFKNNTVLEAKERLFLAVQKRRYGYQYMEADNALIICWDNAPHHPEISTHPHHKHIKTRQNVQASEEMNLAAVLAFIAKTLLVLAFLVTIRQIFVS